jgi:hypothetical protein
MRKAGFSRHRTDRPVRRVRRRGAQRPLDHCGNLIVVDGSRSAGTSLVEQAIAAILQEAAAFANRVFIKTESRATNLLGNPSAHRRMMRHRSARDRATRPRARTPRIGPFLGPQLNGAIGRPFTRAFAISALLQGPALFHV